MRGTDGKAQPGCQKKMKKEEKEGNMFHEPEKIGKKKKKKNKGRRFCWKK